eukprot:SAG11_NODE_259_length_11534_cov_3.402361_15_plen_67_part_00
MAAFSERTFELLDDSLLKGVDSWLGPRLTLPWLGSDCTATEDGRTLAAGGTEPPELPLQLIDLRLV